ncbi:DUF2490 domain-containing protein [Sphingobium sp.]|uniref:DUF2490 domain-containing protein n=1 Tax=Sphingobium sp. TaxID=1912891 RepID=UPI002617A209|nr:DUF2490 domain-containing protein [Sphingobium sp.]
MGAITLFHCTPAFASQDSQLWTIAGSTIRLTDKIRVSQETIARFSDDRGGLYDLETNLMAGYQLREGLTIWVGYTHDPNYAAGRFATMESRIRQQVTWDNVVKLGPGRVSVRLLTEERWRRGADGTGIRLRPFVRYAMPLGTKTGMTLAVSHESFLNLSRTGYQSTRGEERMRNAILLALPVSHRLNFEAGYIRQDGFVHHAANATDHIASVALRAAF